MGGLPFLEKQYPMGELGRRAHQTSPAYPLGERGLRCGGSAPPSGRFIVAIVRKLL